MSVLSKIVGMSIPYNCYEILHTSQPDCNIAALTLGESFFREGLKLYIPFYVIELFMKGKLSFHSCMNTLKNIFTSSAFLGFLGFGLFFFSCLLRKLLGKFYFLSYSYIPTFISCLLALLFERKTRRLPLALYTANVATEIILRMATDRGLLKPVPNAEIYLFSFLMAVNLYTEKKYGCSKDAVSSIFKFILGDNEARQNREENLFIYGANFNLERAASCGIEFKDETETSFMKRALSTIRHWSCPHDTSCFLYCLQGLCRPFLIGCVASGVSRCLSFRRNLISNPLLLLYLLADKRILNLGLFLGGFGFIYRFINCCLRWYFEKDQANYAIPAAMLGGLFMKLHPSPTISLYLMWKTIEKVYLMGMERSVLPHVKYFTPLLFAASSALVCHVGVFEPHNIRPAYVKYLGKLSNNCLIQCSKHALVAFGSKSS